MLYDDKLNCYMGNTILLNLGIVFGILGILLTFAYIFGWIVSEIILITGVLCIIFMCCVSLWLCLSYT